MKTEPGINYGGNIPFDQQRSIDQRAYANYYRSCYDSEFVLTFNSWYGTDLHEKFAKPFLRKAKLEQIKKAVI